VDVFCGDAKGKHRIQNLDNGIVDLNTDSSAFGVFLGSTTSQRYHVGCIIGSPDLESDSSSEIGKVEISLVPVDILGQRGTPIFQSVELKPL